jgi:basic membrane lipoprotein Med (substrate-binding protein (PBP1-ABC) superfamily)
MRTAAALLVLACALGGCGGGKQSAASKTTTASPPAASAPEGLHVGLVGPLSVHVPGAVIERGTLKQVAGDPLVVVSEEDPAAGRVRAVATADPVGHYAVVGASEKSPPLPNLAGLVFREDQAARLGGIVAGLVVTEESAASARVAWVGPQERALAAAFVRGVHEIAPATVVLRAWSADRPAACKEAALGALARGATIVMARGGLCASAAIAGAHQQNHPGLRLSDFLRPDVPATQIVRDAVDGVYHGGEDLVFGAASGAVGIRVLDPRISPTTAVRARAAAQELASGRPPSG